MDRASTALGCDSAGEKYGEFQQEVVEAARNVKKLELMMAIVAPMKAGKSTIINAIVGQEILPSRNAAMTTLPTEIVFNAELAEPTLTLSAEILPVFQETLRALQCKIDRAGMDWAQDKLSQHPHLMELLGQIQAGILGFLTQTVGREEIIKTLTGLNDVIRLCSMIEPSVDPLSLVDVPQIQTPFWRSQGTDQSESLGNLVIVDTPGPNEAGENLRLAAVVEEQLKKSSMVLIVLDFTQLKTEAAEKVKKDVQQVVNLRGKENLYVLINKVDQRRESDMTPEQVRQFVAAELGLGDGDTDRVFEVSARRAFAAANFMQEIEQHPDVSIAQMKTARTLAQEVFGIDWEEELEDATVEDVQKKAQRLWKKSGFDPFLEKAINALTAEAAPRCMMSALNLSRSCLVELGDDVKLRSSAINEDEEKLRCEVGALEADLQRLEKCRNRLQEVDRIKNQLYQELNKILEDLKQDAQVSLETYFNEEKFQRANLFEKGSMLLKKKGMEAINFVDCFNLNPWLQLFREQEKTTSNVILNFDTFEEAENFAVQAIAFPKERLKLSLESVREEVEEQIEQERKQLTDLLKHEAEPIIEQARERLNETFNVNLSLPTPTLDSDDIDFAKPRVESKTRQVAQGYEAVKKRAFWHWLWLVTYEKQVKRPDKTENYYTVSLQEIVDEANRFIEHSIKNIKQGIKKYLGEDFKQRVDLFFNDLDRYLSNYWDSLIQAQKDQKLKSDEKDKLVKELNSLVSEVTEKVRKVDAYLEYTGDLMRNK